MQSQAAKHWTTLSLCFCLFALFSRSEGFFRWAEEQLSLSHEDSEDRGNLSDDCEEVTPISMPLSPSQYFGSLMKHSGSREKLLAQAAVEPAKNSGSSPLSLSPTLPLQQDSTTDKEGETDSDVDRWVRSQQRLRPPPTDEAGKPAGSPKPPAGSSSSSSLSSVNKQATARQVAAELIRHGDLSLSSSLVSASGNMDNFLPLQVNNDPDDKRQRMPVFTEDQRARLQKSRAERTEPQNIMESSSSVEHASAREHVLSNERKQKELQELLATLRRYCVHSTLVPAIVPIFPHDL